MLYRAIAFGLWAVTALTQLILIDLIRTRLSAHHPEIFRSIKDAAWPNKASPMANSVSNFVFKRRDQGLNDPALTKLVTLCQAVQALGLLAFLGLAATILTGHK